MHKARDGALQEISPVDLSGGTHAQRVFGEVVHAQVHHNGFVSGSVRVGRTNVTFDSYSFPQARDGLHLGPFFLRKYDPATSAPLRKHGLFSGGRARGTMIYGTVIQLVAGKHRFLDAVVADELHFFWSTLQYGREFVHANWRKYFSGGTDDACGELFAAACLLVGDAHTLARTTTRWSTDAKPAGPGPGPGAHAGLGPGPGPGRPTVRIRQDAVSFALLLSLLSHSAEPFRLFAQVAKLYVEPSVLQRLRFPSPCTRELAETFVSADCTVDASALPPGTMFHELTPGHVHYAALEIVRSGAGATKGGKGRSCSSRKDSGAAKFGGIVENDDDDNGEDDGEEDGDDDDDGDAESTGVLSDDEGDGATAVRPCPPLFLQ